MSFYSHRRGPTEVFLGLGMEGVLTRQRTRWPLHTLELLLATESITFLKDLSHYTQPMTSLSMGTWLQGRGCFWHPESLKGNGVWTRECNLCLSVPPKTDKLPTVNERSNCCPYQDSFSYDGTNPNQNSITKNRFTDSVSQSPEVPGVHIRDPGHCSIISRCPLSLSL